MKNTIFTGAGVAIITPMHADQSVNYEKYAELIEEQIAGGTDAIITCGTTGESSTLTVEEHLDVMRFCVKQVAGRVPVIAGTGSNDTASAIHMSIEAREMGADAILLVTPYYNKATQRGLIRHYTAIADAAKLPCILYNVPSRTGTDIAVSTYVELAKHPYIVAVKEASGSISKVAQIAAACGDSLDIYSGNDDQIVPILSLGGKGVISVLSNVVPRETHDIVDLYLHGKVEESRALQLKYLSLIDALFCEVNPIPVKEALNLMGKDVGPVRLPLCEMADETRARLSAELEKHGLLAH